MKKIMVVDDNEDFLAAMKGFLKQTGYDVDVSKSCQGGLELLVCFKPDLIFLDIDVGPENGLDMCGQIKSMSDYKHIPVILISGNYDALKAYKEYGADDFLKKPFVPSQLLNKATVHLSRRAS